MWDSAGLERYRALIPSYVRGASIIFIVYEISSKDSFNNLNTWINFIKQVNTDNSMIVLCGNKTDLQRKVTTQEGQILANKEKMLFFEVSAKTGTNINDDMFNSIIQDLLDNMEAEEKEKIQVKNPNKDNDDMFDSIIQNLFDDMETEEKKKENNNHTYNIYNDNKQGKLSFNGQNKDIIEINKNSCWSAYCPCCPCLGKTEKDNEEQKEIENDE